MSDRPYKIALVAGEASSDLIGATLIEDLLQIYPDAEILAVGGQQIKHSGARLLLDNEVFSVMGLAEVLKDLPRLLRTKKQVVKDLLAFAPDVFIGVDSPDLNFAMAKDMQRHGIPVIHYVSPSVWAWRSKRKYKMAGFIDCLLTLFPFEVAIYEDTAIQARFVGHPLASRIPVNVDKVAAKAALGVSAKPLMAVLPGSRNREIKQLMPVFAQAIKQLNLGDRWQLVSSNVSPEKVALVQSLAAQEGLSLHWVDDTSALLQAADFALLGSGTVALEAMLCKTPMVVAYRISALTWWLVNTFNMMQLPYYSLPNVLHGDFLVPEVMQNDLTTTQLARACQQVMEQADQSSLIQRFTELHQQLLPDHPNQAAQAVSGFMEQAC
ncbi:lipid-A-disaccharide synthase [Marinicella meishanensis]|uniref:lipid-A-disaccharide synthase n=1 Tax=Marinicella meishanensis TaxID=2873263 RepID=UPI001CC194A4|nr:lipid-A-disaccharide synthase [Marinicella sp. NBU2979]